METSTRFRSLHPNALNLRPSSFVLAALLALGCNALRLAPAPVDKPPEKEPALTLPGKKQQRVSQFVFASDFEIQRDLPLFVELAQLRDQVYKELQLPAANTVVQVYLFENRDRYEKYMKAKYPDLPKRRAFFVAQPRAVGGGEDLLVYTYWGDRIQQDLRHELTHALLHSVLKDVPLWLDEGLAEFFETPPDWQGVNYHHLDLIFRNPNREFKPDLARLEQMSQVQQMNPSEYREAWGWVHLMLRDRPEAKAVLVAYLQSLRNSTTPGPLGPKLAAAYPDPAAALKAHLQRLDQGPRPATAAAKR